MDFLFYVNSAALGVGLAMDAFSVSLANGLREPKMQTGRICAIAGVYAAFQYAMPVIGWVCVHTVVTAFSVFEKFIPWIALVLLLFIGGKMLLDAFRKEEKKSFDPRSLRTQVVFAVATSIDALAIGITFACTGYATMGSLTWPLVAIGAVSFLGSLLGFALAFRFGEKVTRRFKPEILGGLILIAIGVKVLIEHLTA